MDVDASRLLPVACTLGPDDGAARLDRWKQLYDEYGAGRDAEPDLVTLRFRDVADVATQLGELVVAERECCGFLDWRVDAEAGEVVVLIGGTEEALASLPLGR
ncbi:MAG TPA: hypothetical protein VG708_10105 [Mycobacteriales bacterium]|nr:hypothetical protein [Mycobacteriales bacterium]